MHVYRALCGDLNVHFTEAEMGCEATVPTRGHLGSGRGGGVGGTGASLGTPGAPMAPPALTNQWEKKELLDTSVPLGSCPSSSSPLPNPVAVTEPHRGAALGSPKVKPSHPPILQTWPLSPSQKGAKTARSKWVTGADQGPSRPGACGHSPLRRRPTVCDKP